MLVALHVKDKIKQTKQNHPFLSLENTILVLQFPNHCSNKWILVEALRGIWDMGVPTHRST